MNENSTEKGYLGAELAQANTVLTTKLARVGTTLLAILLGLLLAACPSDSSSGGGTGGDGNGGNGGGPITIVVPGLDNFAVAVTDDAGTEVTITWEYPATSSIATAEITFGDDPAVSINAPTTTRVVTGLTAGTEYSGSVVTIDTDGNRSEATTFAFTPVDPAPSEVSGFSGITNALGTEITLNWTDPTITDLASVEISYPGVATPVSTSGATTTTVTGFTHSNMYTFSAVAVDGGGNRSGAVDATVATADLAPGQATGLTALILNTNTLLLRWTNPADPDLAHVAISVTRTGVPAETRTSMDPAPSMTTYFPALAALELSPSTEEGYELTITGLSAGAGAAVTYTVQLTDAGGMTSTSSSFTAQTTQRAIAIWSIGVQDSDFNFFVCQPRLDAVSDAGVTPVTGEPIARQLKTDGYQKAYFFGSTPSYNYSALATSGNALQLDAAIPAVLAVVHYSGSTTVVRTTRFGTPTAVRTIGELVNTTSEGAFSSAGGAIMSTVIGSGTPAGLGTTYWSFTRANAYDSASSCAGATSILGMDSGIVGSASANGVSSGSSVVGDTCNLTRQVICVAK